eukprot:c19041_g1_i2.p1 GENE.c19041_g1_i2~~c19041_g1_i2.p1  ORF type:complete len:145 (-),score=13.47 c19041_g1_i2:157-591(-)
MMYQRFIVTSSCCFVSSSINLFKNSQLLSVPRLFQIKVAFLSSDGQSENPIPQSSNLLTSRKTFTKVKLIGNIGQNPVVSESENENGEKTIEFPLATSFRHDYYYDYYDYDYDDYYYYDDEMILFHYLDYLIQYYFHYYQYYFP